jgi:hypothetical protein
VRIFRKEWDIMLGGIGEIMLEELREVAGVMGRQRWEELAGSAGRNREIIFGGTGR